MLSVLAPVYCALLTLVDDPETPKNMPLGWGRGRRNQNSQLPRDSKHEGLDEFTPVVRLFDYLYYSLRNVGKTCKATCALLVPFHKCFHRDSSHVGSELDDIGDMWGVGAAKLLAAAMKAIETDIAELGQTTFDAHLNGVKKDVLEFMHRAGSSAAGVDAEVSAAPILEKVNAGNAAVEIMHPDLDEDIRATEEKLAKLKTLREERDVLKNKGKRLRDELSAWVAAEGVLKRAK